MPMRRDPFRLTNPQAGVMATRPATAPEAAPREVALPWWNHSIRHQVMAAMAVAVLVVTKALQARALAAQAEPALKPNQPNHRRLAPKSTMVRLWGTMDSLP